ncbi:MAG TPA: substrate-binding domain-containing protein [Paraburkholderia sp.]|uniref:PstS family phosphate ABC transporter substrate-binding protein n=1 Tax=Paraburkholderia sp. TaxID=1926495 RepID=UPI002ED31112
MKLASSSKLQGTASVLLALAGLALGAAQAVAQTPDVNQLPAYKPEYSVKGGLRIAGNDLKGNVALLAEGFKKFHPDAVISTNFMTNSEGALGMMYAGVSEIAPMGDDAKISDQMPFYNAFRHVPTEISIATGGYDQRGTLFAWAIVVNKDNPLAKLSMGQLDRIFGSERTGGWEIGADANNNLLYTSKYARGPETNIRTWGQLGLNGDWANKEIQTYGYIAPGFEVNFERKVMHWSDKWNPNFKEYVEEKEATTDAAGKAVASERMLEDISNNKYGIGWAALMHVKDYPNVKVLAISQTDNSRAITLTPDNVRNRSYPLTRDAYIYVNRTPGEPLDPRVREFIRFVLSRDGQQIIQNAGVYAPLPASYVTEQLKKIN